MNEENTNQDQENANQTLAAPISDAGGVCAHRARVTMAETVKATARQWATSFMHELDTIGVSPGATRNFREVRNMVYAIIVDPRPGHLLRLIDSARMKGLSLWETPSCSKDSKTWEGTAEQLANWLEQSTVTDAVRSLTMELQLSRLVGRLATEAPTRVKEHRTSIERRWRIYERGEEPSQ